MNRSTSSRNSTTTTTGSNWSSTSSSSSSRRFHGSDDEVYGEADFGAMESHEVIPFETAGLGLHYMTRGIPVRAPQY